MCGVTGVVSGNKQLDIRRVLKLSSDIQMHRGPDMQGEYVCEDYGLSVGLSHQRLSILDLSEAGKQPMSSKSSRSIISYNGEVYNYKELALEFFPGWEFSSDTQVVLELLEEKGIFEALNSFNGMWAFAWLDIRAGKLYLARDRLGVKPLYYTVHDGDLYFSSEIKGVLAACNRKFKLNHRVVSDFLDKSLQDVDDETFFEGIFSLSAGCYIEIDLSSPVVKLECKKYWSMNSNVSSISFGDAVSRTRQLFEDAVALRMRSDVPVGVTLSGGLDSSAIAAVMKGRLVPGQKLTALSVVSPGGEYDESYFIDVMEKNLECDVERIVLDLSPDNAIQLLRKATWHNDSPVASFSNVAHYLMMEKAKELGITVILSGQGADELLCGYKKYVFFAIQFYLRSNNIKNLFSLVFSFLFNRTVFSQFNLQEAKRYFPRFLRVREIDIKGRALKGFGSSYVGLSAGQDVVSRQVADVKHFSVPYLTHYEDRMSMAWSREIRLPFLDYRLVSFFLSLPVEYKLSKGWTKYVFRKALASYLPSEICWRKDKQGFVNPQESWLRKELKDTVIDIFSESALIFKFDLVDREKLLRKYDAFCSGGMAARNVWYRDIFNPISLEVWLCEFSDYLEC